MALLTTHGATNLVDIEPERTYTITLGYYFDAGGTVIHVTEDRTEHRFEYRGMTKAAAVTCVTDMYSTYTAGTVNAVAVRVGDSPMYNVNVTVSTTTVNETAVV